MKDEMLHITFEKEYVDKLREVIVVLDSEGKIIMANKVAKGLVEGYRSLELVDFDEVYPRSKIKEYIKKRENLESHSRAVNGKLIIFEGMPIQYRNEYAYLIMGYDTTDMKRLSEELKGKENLIESMRVVNHDFMNKMHVMMGYLETGQYDEAKRFIYNIKSVPTKEISKINDKIKNPQISALIVGKMIRGKEIGVRVNVVPGSECQELTEGVSEEEYVTIIGNLIENSIEELNSCTKDEKEVDVFISTNYDWTLITITDNGKGIQADDVDKVFEMGYSTKGTNRGIGIPIIRQIARKHGGNIEVESEKDEGCTITVSMKSRNA